MQENTLPKQTVATRHNNPLNVKYGAATRKFVDSGEAELGEKAKDGGRFLRFKTPEIGFTAAKDLLFGGNYKDLDIDSAMKKWSNSGYGSSEIAPDIDPITKVAQLTEDERSKVVQSMARREGFGADLPEDDEGEGVKPPASTSSTGATKHYKLTDKKTGKTITAALKAPPTPEDMKKIFSDREKHEFQRGVSEKKEKERPLTAKIADVLFAPSEFVAPEVKPPEEVKKLSIPRRVARIGQETLSGLISPEGIATTLPAIAGGPVGLAASGIAGLLQLGTGFPKTTISGEGAELDYEGSPAYEQAKATLQDPSLENVARSGLVGLGLAGGVAGTKIGLARGKAPAVVPPTRPNTNLPAVIERSEVSAGPKPIEAEFVEPVTYRDVPEPTPQPTRGVGGIPQRAAIPEEAGPVVTPPGPPRLPARGEQPVRGQGFTMGAPREILPTIERPFESPAPPARPSNISEVIKYGGEEGSRLTSEPTGFIVKAPEVGEEVTVPKLLKENSQTLLTRKENPATPEQAAIIDEILQQRGILPDDNEIFPIETPAEAPIAPTAPVDRGTTGKGGKPLTAEEFAKGRSEERGGQLPSEQGTELSKRVWDTIIEGERTRKANLPPEGERRVPIETKIESGNKWLLDTSTGVLKNMVEGARGRMKQDIEAILADRGVEVERRAPVVESPVQTPKPAATPAPKPAAAPKAPAAKPPVAKEAPKKPVAETTKATKVEAPEAPAKTMEQMLQESLAAIKGKKAGVKSEPKVESPIAKKPVIEEPTTINIPEPEPAATPTLDEAAFTKYNEWLEDMVSMDTVESSRLREIAEQGKQAGLDSDTVIQDLIDNMPRIKGATNKARIAAHRVFRSGESGFGTIDLFTRLGRKAKGTEAEGPINEAKKQITFMEKTLTKPERVIGRMGESGLELERKLEDAQWNRDTLKGQVDVLAHDAFRNLTPKEAGVRYAVMSDGSEVRLNTGNMDKYVNWNDGTYVPKPGVQRIIKVRGSLEDVISNGAKPANEKIAKAAEFYNKAIDILATEGEASEVSLFTQGNKRIPFTKADFESWPRGYTEGFFKSLSPEKKAALAKELAANKGLTIKEATSLLENEKLFPDLTTRAGTRRLFKQDSFVIDPQIFFDKVNSFSGRVGLSKALGPNDIKSSLVAPLLQKIANEGFDNDFATSTVRRLVGKEGKRDKPAPGEATAYKAITNLNNARLMTSFVINNLGGITPMVARVGGVNTFKGLAAYLSNMEVARRMATLSGARKGGIIEGESNFVGKHLGINASEKFIRTWADQSGRVAVNQLVTHLNEVSKASPEFIRGKKLLDSLVGKDSLELIERGTPTPDELSRAGWQLAKDAHGLINPATFPAAWDGVANNFFTNVALQYKRMAGQSMGSLIESFRLNPARTIATLSIVSPILGEIIGDTGSALFGLASGGLTGEGSTKAAIEDVKARGESLQKGLIPLLQRQKTTAGKRGESFGLELTDTQAKLVARYIDNMNRGFALGLIGDLIYSTAYWGGMAAGDIAAGGWSPAYEFGIDIAKSIMNKGKDLGYLLIPQRLGSAMKRSEERMKPKGTPLVRPPRLSFPRLP